MLDSDSAPGVALQQKVALEPGPGGREDAGSCRPRGREDGYHGNTNSVLAPLGRSKCLPCVDSLNTTAYILFVIPAVQVRNQV